MRHVGGDAAFGPRSVRWGMMRDIRVPDAIPRRIDGDLGR
jgi:hypothetical protein